jgi:phage-related protein
MASRRWRFYASTSGRVPVREFLDGLDAVDAVAVIAEMRAVAREGLARARHLRGDLYEVRADGHHATFRVIFATEGRRGQVLLAIGAFSKKTRRTPENALLTAERRLRDWRTRGR